MPSSIILPSPPASRRAALFDGALQCCGSCRWWDRSDVKEINGEKIAECFRYPRTAVLITTMAKHPLTGAQVMQQGPGTVPTLMPMNKVCGDYAPCVVPGS